MIKKEVAVPLVAATTFTTPSSRALVAPTKAKVSLATRVSLALPTSRPRAKAGAVAAPAITTTGASKSRAVVTPAAPRLTAPKVSLAARVSLAPPTARPRSALAPTVAPAQSRIRPASQARSGTLQTAVAAPQKPKVSLANRVSLAPRARGADRVLPQEQGHLWLSVDRFCLKMVSARATGPTLG